jgi:hypothetical protein
MGIGILDNHTAVPMADSTDNLTTADVIGNKTDTHDGNSAYATIHRLDEHVHTPSIVLPDLSDGVTLTAVNDGNTWTLGAIAQIVGPGVTTEDLDVHFISVEALSANSIYQIKLYYGTGNTLCGSTVCTKNAAQDGTMLTPIHTNIIPAGEKISAAVATTANNGETVVIRLLAHTYS